MGREGAYAIVIGENGRVMCAAAADHAPLGAWVVVALPQGDIHDYRVVEGAYVHDPVAIVEAPRMPTPMDDLTAMTVDHEYRMLLMEMGVSTSDIPTM